MSDDASYYDVITSLLYTNKILLGRSSWANFEVVWLIWVDAMSPMLVTFLKKKKIK